MRNISFRQILILLLVFFFLFGDLFNLKNKITNLTKHFSDLVFKENKKKGG